MRAENTPPPPPPPPGPPRGEDAPPAPPGNPDEDDAKYNETHARLWYELQGPPVYDGPDRRDKVLSFLTWKEEHGFVRARNWSKCPVEYYLTHDMPHTFSVKQRDAMYESFHVND